MASLRPPLAKWLAHFSRDRIIFFWGLIGVLNETFFQEVERPALIILFAAMMGVTGYMKSSGDLRKKTEEDTVN